MFLGKFQCLKDIIDEFRLTPEQAAELARAEILFAFFDEWYYDGQAFVLFRLDGRLFEVHGFYNSNFGLEEQWAPEEANLAELRHRLEHGTFGRDDFGDNLFADELSAFLLRIPFKEVQI